MTVIDPRGVRVAAPHDDPGTGGEAIAVEPLAVPLGSAGHRAAARDLAAPEPSDQLPGVLVDGRPVQAGLRRLDPIRAVLLERDESGHERHTRVLRLDLGRSSGAAPGTRRSEILVDGWSIVVELESEHRAALRERARRGAVEAAHRGPTEVRAIIPGRILSVSVAAGDGVVAGQQLLIVEAMKMQNELRAPRDGTIERIAVGEGATIEVGDLLLVLA